MDGLFELKLFATDFPLFLFFDIDLFLFSFFINLLLFKYVFNIFGFLAFTVGEYNDICLFIFILVEDGIYSLYDKISVEL